uniref:root meristem growth factor 10 n=1 Tax=Erigeron canadensis TaxID=72917 RepID=UPI001CB914E4|nr:root meristem growth factor 10 [Erigeron canadensis]
MSRMLVSSSSSLFVLVVLSCLSLECNGRHLNSIIIDDDNKANLPSHSTISKQQGFMVDSFTVPDDVTEKNNYYKDRLNNVIDHKQQADCGSSKNKEQVIKDQKVKKVKEEESSVQHRHHHHEHLHPKLVTYRVPPKNKRVHQQPGFNLDYSPPKTHPPSHN